VGAIALYLAFYLRTRVWIPGTETLLPPEKVRFTAENLAVIVGTQGLAMSLFGLYGARERFRDPLARLLIPAVFFQLLLLASFYFLAFAQPYAFPRSVLVVYVLLDAVLLALWRAVLDRLFPQPRRRGALVGSGPPARLIADARRARVGGRRPHGASHRGRHPEAPLDGRRGRRRDRRGRGHARPAAPRAGRADRRDRGEREDRRPDPDA
jgi:FlaA1/EpsC-like NDP-sugar epimerase